MPSRVNLIGSFDFHKGLSGELPGNAYVWILTAW